MNKVLKGLPQKKIGRRLVIHILLVGLLPLALGLGLTYYYGIQALQSSIGANFREIAIETGKRVDALLDEEIQRLRSLAIVPIRIIQETAEANQAYRGLSEEAISKQLLKLNQTWIQRQGGPALSDRILNTESSQYLKVNLELQDRRLIGILVTDRYGALVAASTLPKQYYFGKEPWWRAVMEKKEVYISGVLPQGLGSFGEMEETIEIALPIQDSPGGRILGVVMSSYGFSNLLPAVLDVRIDQTGHAMLLDSEGTPLICPILPVARHRVQPSLVEKIRSPSPGWFIAPDDAHGAQNTIVGYAPVPMLNSLRASNLDKKSWHILIRQHPSESYAPAYVMLRRVILLGGLLVGLLSLSGLYVGSRISRPIRDLQEGARRLGEGQLDQPLAIQTRDELEVLAQEFNLMAAKIRMAQKDLARCNRDLELKVQERTAELIQSEEKRREAYAQLMHADKLASLGQMAAEMAHEIGNPLSSISAMVQVLETGKVPQEQFASNLSSLKQLVNRIDRTLRGILTFTRPAPQKLEPMNLNQAIEEAVRITSLDARFKKVRIDQRLAKDLPDIQGDYGQMVQVFVNLMLNAADAVFSAGRITIETKQDREGEGVVIRLSDTGQGIPPEALSKIFEPFYTTKAPGRGTGLGLPICRTIIEGLKGKIEVESEVGKGTTFTMTLPLGAKTILTKQISGEQP